MRNKEIINLIQVSYRLLGFGFYSILFFVE